MASTLVFTCDVCGKQRGEANHWFVAQPYEGHMPHPGLAFFAWGGFLSKPGSIHLCGQGCAIKHLSEFLTEAK